MFEYFIPFICTWGKTPIEPEQPIKLVCMESTDAPDLWFINSEFAIANIEQIGGFLVYEGPSLNGFAESKKIRSTPSLSLVSELANGLVDVLDNPNCSLVKEMDCQRVIYRFSENRQIIAPIDDRRFVPLHATLYPARLEFNEPRVAYGIRRPGEGPFDVANYVTEYRKFAAGTPTKIIVSYVLSVWDKKRKYPPKSIGTFGEQAFDVTDSIN